jgi:rhomboid family GlyGly-CTERM serine protease
LYSIDAAVHSHLNFQSQAILSGEFWRLITGHFLHTNFEHLMLNIGGLFLLWALHGEYYEYGSTVALALLCGILTSVGLLLASDTTHYVGLSAIIHAIFAWGAIQDIRCGLRSGWMLLLGLSIKVAYEQIYGGSAEVAEMIGADVAVDSHLWGAVSGLFLALFFKAKRNTSEQVVNPA